MAATAEGTHARPDRPSAPPELYRRLLLLTGARLLVGTALLVATAWLTLGGETDFGRRVDALLYATIGSIYLGSLVAVFFLRSGRHLREVAYAQIVGDALAASGLVYLTGGAESVFCILYPLAIVNAAISLSRRGAVVGAVVSSFAFTVLAVSMEAGLLGFPAAYLERPPLPMARLVLTLATNLSAFALTAALSAYLADALQGARSQLERRETQLSALAELHENIVRSVASGLLTVNRDGCITYLNPAGEEIIGRRLREIAGERLERHFSGFAQALNDSPPGRGETRLVDSGGKQRIVGYSVAPLLDPAMPASSGCVIVFQDLTLYRDMEEAIRRNDRLAALGSLAAGLAHEIRNPLASMCGSIELLGRVPGLREKDRRLLQIVLREGERLDALVHDFLSFARPPSPQLSTIDGTRALEESLAVFAPQAAARRLIVSTELAKGVRLQADAAQLKQVLWNLLSNACDACSEGGHVSIRLGRQGAKAILEVKDDGPGIDPGDLPRLFDPFFTTKQGGTGLGLAIVHRIVEAHHGHIEISSARGIGTTIRIELPAGPAVEQTLPVPAA